VPRLVVSPRARGILQRLIERHSLPRDALERFAASIEPLADFPLLGTALGGRWTGYRYVLGPWRWMLVVYEYLPDDDLIGVVTVQDGRSAQSPTTITA
jgi:plasmid stabilization system protein ParE